jgi:hypothetical protein
MNFAEFLTGKQHCSMQETELGNQALKSWVVAIKLKRDINIGQN